MQGETQLLIELTRKAAKFLHRDYFELENLQRTGKTNIEFCLKSRLKLAEILTDGLNKYYKKIIKLDDEWPIVSYNGKAVIFETVDNIYNLSRALPYFAIILSVVNITTGSVTPEKTIINFPILGEVYYAEKGKGAWLERYISNFGGNKRLRVSEVKNFVDSLIMTSGKETSLLAEKLAVSQLTSTSLTDPVGREKNLDEPKSDNIRTKKDNIIKPAAPEYNLRDMGSYAFIIAMLISGKADIGIFEINQRLQAAFELLLQEAGGRTLLKNNIMIATNFNLYGKIESIIAGS